VKTRATIPTNFRLRGGFSILDCRVSERKSKNRFTNVLCTRFSSNRKSAIENLKSFNSGRDAGQRVSYNAIGQEKPPNVSDKSSMNDYKAQLSRLF
jgi:hypothetical protein